LKVAYVSSGKVIGQVRQGANRRHVRWRPV